MNAAMHKYELTDDENMPAGENDNLAAHVAELRSDVCHIQSDVADIKADQRVTHQRIESLRKETAEGFAKVDQRFESLRQETAEGFAEVDQKLESVKKEIGEFKDSLSSAMIWALGLSCALATSLLFFVLAKGFKWL